MVGGARMNLFCFGLGYSAQHYIAAFGRRFDGVIGTVRTREKAEPLGALIFDGTSAPDDVVAALMQADALLVSIAPDEHGDPVLTHFDHIIAASPVASIVYLSTIGVYGDHEGRWIDETTPANPVNARSTERLAAEAAWRALGHRARKPVAILRLSGIYGPRQSALTQLVSGTAKRIVKPGQVFNRIHVGDIAQAIDAAITRRADGVFNVTDDEPTPAPDVVAYAAELLGVTPPPEIPYAQIEASMSPMAKSFYGEVKRVRNDKMKRELGVKLKYPTYREGIKAIHMQG
jgi:nucleoside-diphosphate-sugar epimerase